MHSGVVIRMGGKRVVELQVMGGYDNTKARYEVEENTKIGDLVRRYLKEHDPSLLNAQSGYTIAVLNPDGKISQVDENMTVRDLITNVGTDTIQIVPKAQWG